MDFSSKCYDEQMEYYEYSRDRIESLLRGINIFSFQYEDNREVIETFFNQKIEELEKVKEKEKKKV